MSMEDLPEFEGFQKIPRLRREVVITEKIDGTNAQVFITEEGRVLAGSRNRWITPNDDNYGFAKWVEANKGDLLSLGPGRHFGEWWGNGIQRGYGLANGDKRFSLFNVSRWGDERPECCGVVPTLYAGEYDEHATVAALETLRSQGSVASPGFMKPEGIIVYHTASKQLFKVTCEKDDKPKGIAA